MAIFFLFAMFFIFVSSFSSLAFITSHHNAAMQRLLVGFPSYFHSSQLTAFGNALLLAHAVLVVEATF